MRVKDLGLLDGEVTVFGGPYSNRQAVVSLLEVAQGTLICTGDLVAYCGAPMEVVETVRRAGVHVVAGNCETQLAARALDCGCGFDDGSACDLLSAGWYGFANEAVHAQARDWMATLPDLIVFSHAGLRYAVVHGGVSDIARFLWSVSDERDFSQEIQLINGLCGHIDVVLAGHSGIAFEREIGGTHWVNAGVIGMPPNDGTQQTEYLRIDGTGRRRFERLSYDVAAAVADMERAGLMQGYHLALQTGHWPSEDVLPEVLRR